jgi:hypothetical protein
LNLIPWLQRILTKVLFAERQDNIGIVGVKLIDGAGNLPESKEGSYAFVAFTK